jgi:thioredoxin 2
LLARQLKPNWGFAKLNTEDEPEPAARFNIRSIPTLIVFRAEIARQSSVLDVGTMTRWLQSAVG